MLLFAVIPESLAMIGRQHDGRAVVEALLTQVVEQPADDLVRVFDLTVVRFRLRESRRR